ncbi:MAG: BTAD domain-containing putative transcriptional regulator [Thermoleophilaceae bacterium]
MDFRLLGPLEVLTDDGAADVGTGKRAALLTYLLINANEVVSAERLIEGLWDEHPPATAAKIVQVYVSQLRKALDANGNVLMTRGSGYVVAVDERELDIKRFERGLSEAKLALEADDAKHAARLARDALALWRGPALYDVAYESFAQIEAARLDQLRLDALETRIEAELALGKHSQLVGELEALVAEHPSRERFRAQLMVALYRSGRQSDALEVYRQGTRLLMDEFGLEPSPELRELEQKIIEHSEELGAQRAWRPVARRRQPADGTPPAAAAQKVRRGARLLVAGGALLAAAVTFAVIELTGGGGPSQQPQLTRDSVALLDPATGRVLASAPVGRTPTSVALGAGAAWALNADDQTISRIDVKSKQVKTFGVGATPTDLAVGAGALWVGNAFQGGVDRFGSYPRSIARIDPESGVVDATIVLPTAGAKDYFQGGGANLQHVAATDTAVWVINPDQTVSRIDPKTNRRVATVKGVAAESIAADEERAWVVEEGAVVAIDANTNKVVKRIEVAAESLTTVAIGGGSVWVADPLGGSVWRIDPDPQPRLRQIPLDLGVRAVAYGRGAAWVTNEIADKVQRIDPRTNRARVVSRVVAPQHLAVDASGVWVAALGRPSGAETLPASSCGRLVAGARGPSDVIVASELPLQGGDRPLTKVMADAIRFALERRGFKAGRYTVGYQSCDYSTAQAGGPDVYRCFSNAKAYARTLKVVGVIGAYHSFCSAFEIPVLGQAPGGPVAMISPSNTITSLTRPQAAMRPGQLRDLYPRGERNYVRIAASDHVASMAVVDAVRRLHRKRLFFLTDRDDSYSVGNSAEMQAAARSAGLEIAGAAGWNPDARSFARLAGRITARRPDAVLLAGAAPRHPGALIHALRAALGRDVVLIANDGFDGIDQYLNGAERRAATGMYVEYYGVPNSALPARGRRFLREFAKAQGGRPGPDVSAAYGAQAAEILLDAIARSDATRESVTRELRRTNLANGILGPISFDRYGDLVAAPVTIHRVTSTGVVVDRVITVRVR